MDNLYLALKILSISLLVLISIRAAWKVGPAAIQLFKRGNVFLAFAYILPVIALIGLSVYVIVSGYRY